MTRTTIRDSASFIKNKLGISSLSSQPKMSALDLCSEIQYGLIWSRGILSMRDRLIVSLTVCSQKQLTDHLRTLSAAAEKHGLDQKAIIEIFLQTGIYAGFATAESAIRALGSEPGSVDEGVDESLRKLADESLDINALGERTREFLHGERHVDGYANPDHPYASPLYEIANNHCYGLIWNRPCLTMRERLVCALAALGSSAEGRGPFRKFVQAAVRNGISIPEVVEVVIQTVPYSGFPCALANLLQIGEMYPEANCDLGSMRGTAGAQTGKA